MNAALEEDQTTTVKVSEHELSAVADVSWDREVGNVGVMKGNWVIDFIGEAFVAAPKDHGYINLGNLESLLNVVCCR